MTEEQKIQLSLWSEIVGTYNGLFIEQHFTNIKVNNNLISFSNGTKEAETAQRMLNDCPCGTKIGVLKTDIPENPLLVRLIG